MRRAVLCLTLLASSACNCGTQQVHHTSGIIAVLPEGSTTAAVEADTALKFDPQCLQNVAIPAEVKTIVLQNQGESVLSVTSITITGLSAAAFTIDASTPVPTSIAVASSVTLKIDFAPTTMGNQSATLVIATNDPTKGTVNVQLVGSGSDLPSMPTFATACPLLDGGVDLSEQGDCYQLLFPQPGVGMTTTQPIHITNQGCPPLQITAVDIYPGEFGEGPDAGYAWTLHGTAPTVANPLTVAAGKTVDLDLDFHPFTGDFYAATVLVTTNGSGVNAGSATLPDGGPVATTQFAIGLSGTGTSALVFVQPSDCNFNNPAAQCSLTPSGSVVDGTITIVNDGNLALTVTSIALANPQGAGFALGADATTPFTIQANASQSFTVIYTPVAGSVTNTINITTTSGNLSVTLEAGNPPILVTSPASTLDFGDQTQATYSDTANLEVGNIGTGTLVVSNLTIANPASGPDGGVGDCPDFTLDPASFAALPYSIAVDAGPDTAVFHHHPQPHGGQSQCTLSIPSNDPSYPGANGLSVELLASTFRNCDPAAVESPDGTATFAFPDGGNTLTVTGINSYDPGAGDPLGNVAACPGGASQGVKQWDWQLFTDPNLGHTTTSTILPQPGAVSICLKNVGSACTHLLVSNQGSLLQPPTATDSSVQLALDPTYRSHVNLYQLQLIVIDGSADGGFSSPPDTLNVSVQ